jgi:hypothetical protein
MSTLTDQRRFSSLLIAHPELRTSDSLLKRLGASLVALDSVEADRSGWGLRRCEYVAPKNLYPESLVSDSSTERSNGFAHQVYVGAAHLSSLSQTVLVLASPYVRLLQRMVREATRQDSGPAAQFVTLHMPTVYEELERGVPGFAATRVTLQMLNQPGLSLVSLTGRNPLDSELHSQIKSVAAPYSVRTEVSQDDQHVRVNVDRHGNLWWYQTDEGKADLALSLVNLLDEVGATRLSRTLPLDRAESEDDSE